VSFLLSRLGRSSRRGTFRGTTTQHTRQEQEEAQKNDQGYFHESASMVKHSQTDNISEHRRGGAANRDSTTGGQKHRLDSLRVYGSVCASETIILEHLDGGDPGVVRKLPPMATLYSRQSRRIPIPLNAIPSRCKLR
jgi:hypothetical protein